MPEYPQEVKERAHVIAMSDMGLPPTQDTAPTTFRERTAAQILAQLVGRSENTWEGEPSDLVDKVIDYTDRLIIQLAANPFKL